MVQKIQFPMGVEYEVPYNLGDILLFENRHGEDSVDTICEIDIKWSAEVGPHIERMYGKHDHSICEAKTYKEILRKGSWEESHLIKHSMDLIGRLVLINDEGTIHLAKITGMGVHLRDTKGNMYKRYYETTSYDVELDGEDKSQWVLIPGDMHEKVEKWLETKY